jgi:hypothetical protein
MTVPLWRGDEELELNVQYSVSRADPSVGFMSDCAEPQVAEVYSKSERAWVRLELTDAEWEEVTDYINENMYD